MLICLKQYTIIIDNLFVFRITKTVRTLISHSIVSPNESEFHQTMQDVLDQFMSEERNPR